MPSHYLGQCWNDVNSNLRNTFQWNLKRNSYIFIHGNMFGNVVCEMVYISSRLSVLRLQQHVLEVKDIAGWIFWGDTSMYLHSIITAPPISPNPTTHTHPHTPQNGTLLLMTWRCKEPGYHQPWHWPDFPGLLQPSTRTVNSFRLSDAYMRH